MFQLDPKSFADARIQLHWASQLLSAAADARLDKQDDDSQSNLGWNAQSNSLEARTGDLIHVSDMRLTASSGNTWELRGQTLEQSRLWLSAELDRELSFRDYEMPEHDLIHGNTFDPDRNAIADVAAWFSVGQQAMSNRQPLRIWPHHFDMGWLLEIEGPQKSIGGGMSPGDDYFDQPYFYVNPYGIEKPNQLPSLKLGQWAKTWLGVILPADQLLSQENPVEIAKTFIEEQVQMFQRWY